MKRRAPRSVNSRTNLIVFRLAMCCGLRVSETGTAVRQQRDRLLRGELDDVAAADVQGVGDLIGREHEVAPTGPLQLWGAPCILSLLEAQIRAARPLSRWRVLAQRQPPEVARQVGFAPRPCCRLAVFGGNWWGNRWALLMSRRKSLSVLVTEASPGLIIRWSQVRVLLGRPPVARSASHAALSCLIAISRRSAGPRMD